MKKILYASALVAISMFGMASCMNGDYDANPADRATGENPLNQGGNNGSGGSNGGNNSNFNWNGSDPMSAKVNGSGWQAADAMYVPAMTGFPATIVGTGGDNSAIVVSIPNNPTINTTYSFGNNLLGSYSTDMNSQNPDDRYVSGLGGNGQVMITENDDSHIKGKFYFTGKNSVGGSRTVNEGYFNVTK